MATKGNAIAAHRPGSCPFPSGHLFSAIDELGLYLVTHAEDQEVLALYWEYIRLAQEGRARYEAQYGPLTQTTVTEGGYRWLKDPWPWDEGGSD